jgi:hypothetical protein
MKMLLNVRFPHKEFNTDVRDGTIGSKMNRILETIKPEAVYFAEQCGRRSVLVVVDITQASQIPALAEPWFLGFNADVEFHPVMTPEDLSRAGLEELGKKWC